MKYTYLTLLLSALLGCATSIVRAEHADAHVTEQDYLSEMPVVLSVTHMAQPLDEVPGALTIIDREMIRRSGAREVADLLRLVPGFLMTRTQAGLLVGYHAGLDTYGSRMQVYVDGRSVYSSYFIGDTHFGLRGLVLEDIERIEVLRGSNSASYGANAFLGVVNVITRNTADTQGGMVSVTQGDGSIDDNVVRVGWGNSAASFRLTASRRADSGLKSPASSTSQYLVDDSNQSQLNFRGDLSPTQSDSIAIHGGAGEITHLTGSPVATNPYRPTTVHNIFMNMTWQRQLDPNSSLQLRVSHDVENFRDTFRYTPLNTVSSIDGQGQRTELGVQYQTTLNATIRLVTGLEYRREAVVSKPLFATDDKIATQQWRAFGNIEWRASPQWLFQAGGMHESHAIAGSTFSPRLAANYHLLPDHTLRAVATSAYRAPTLFEFRGDRHYRDINTGAIVASTAARSFLAVDGLKHESLRSEELGYVGRFRELGLTVDMRAYHEKINERIKWSTRSVGTYNSVLYARNERGPTLRGYEYSLTWEPQTGTKVLFNDTRIGLIRASPDDNQESPVNTSTLAWFQNLPGGFEGALISTYSSPFRWDVGDQIGISRRLDLRLGKPFHYGATKGEVALTTQSINGGHFIFKKDTKQDRRAFLTLRLDF